MVVRIGYKCGDDWDFNDYIRRVYEMYSENLTHATVVFDVSRNTVRKLL